MSMRPNIVQIENRMRGVPDAALQQMLIQMTQTGQVGTPEYLIAAGEMQARKDLRAKANVPQANPQPVIADLLTAGAMPPPMMPQGVAPEDAGGLAAMEAPNMESIDMAGGGLVAFADGGEIPRYQNTGFVQTPGTVGMPSGMGSAGGFQSAFRGPPDLQELLRKYGKNALKILRSGTGALGLSPSQLLLRSSPLNATEAEELEKYRNLAANQAAYAAGDIPDVPFNEAFNAPVPAQGAPSGQQNQQKQNQTQPGGGLDTLGKAQGLDMESAFTKAQSFIGDKLAALGDPFKDIRDEMKTASDERKADLKNSAWMRLAEFGFGMAAGTSPFALANIGKAGVEALKGYADDLREKKKLDRDDRKMLADLKRLETADKRDNVIKTADLGLKIIGEMNAQQRAELASKTQLAVYGMPGKEERLVDRALRDPKFAEMYRSFSKSGAVDPMLKAYMDMSPAEKMGLDPATRAMLEQRLKTAILPAVVESPGSAKIRD